MYLSRRPRLTALAAALVAAPVALSSADSTALNGADAPAQLTYAAQIKGRIEGVGEGTRGAPTVLVELRVTG